MSRVIAGPFNRVEGDLEVALDITDGIISRAEVTTTLYRGFEQILLGRPALDSLIIAPRICGICSVSQSVAAATALRHLAGVEPAPNGLLATNIAHAAENIADHLTHFYLFFMPDFARADYRSHDWHPAIETRFKATVGTACASFLPARRKLLEIMGLIAGKWPHSLAFQPGGLTRTIDVGERIRLLGIIGEFQRFLETVVFGSSLDDFLSLSSPAELDGWQEGPGQGSDFAAFLAIARALDLKRLGPGPGRLMSNGAYHGPEGSLFGAGLRLKDGTILPLDDSLVREDVARSWFEETLADPALSQTLPDALKTQGYSWAKAPRLDNEPVEVGALARQAVAGHPLILALLARDGRSSVESRIIARLIEVAQLVHCVNGWVRALRLKDAFCVPADMPDEASARGLVEAARGSLGHWVGIRDGAISHYQIIAPTTWNFSPRDGAGTPGPLESALSGLVVGEAGARAVSVQHVVRSFDPCMVCTAH